LQRGHTGPDGDRGMDRRRRPRRPAGGADRQDPPGGARGSGQGSAARPARRADGDRRRGRVSLLRSRLVRDRRRLERGRRHRADHHLTAARVKTRIATTVRAEAKIIRTPRLRPAMAPLLLRPQMSWRPLASPRSPYRIKARPWVSGRKRATHVRKPGGAVSGKSAPAKNHGTIAIAGTRAMYSSCLGTRLASVSAIPYMPTARSAAAAVNHARPVAPVLKLMPRPTATTISVTIWKAVTATATER